MLPQTNIIKDVGRIFFWYPVRWCIYLFPFSAIYWAGKFLGSLDYLFSGRERIERMTRNISDVFRKDEETLKRIVRKNLQNHCIDVLEFIKYPQLNDKKIDKILTVEGIDILERMLAKGNGVIIATAHFGAKQMLQVGLALKGFKVNQINYHMNDKELSFIQRNISQRMRKKIEGRIPANFISARGFLRPAIRCLQKNEILIVAADGIGLPQHMDRGYKPFEFLGKKVLFPINTPLLARRTGAPILPAFVIRDRWRQKIVIQSPISSDKDSVEDVIKKYISLLEKYVGLYPCHWEFLEVFERGILIVEQ